MFLAFAGVGSNLARARVRKALRGKGAQKMRFEEV